jgi:hypothetical protein
MILYWISEMLTSALGRALWQSLLINTGLLILYLRILWQVDGPLIRSVIHRSPKPVDEGEHLPPSGPPVDTPLDPP